MSNDLLSLTELLAQNARRPGSNGSTTRQGAGTRFTNFTSIETDDQLSCRGLDIATIAERLFDLTGGFPKRVGEDLFAVTPGHGVLWFKSPTSLFAWIDALQQVVWKRGADKVTQERFYAYLQQTAEVYDQVEHVPHFPALPGTFYAHAPLPAANGECLYQLVNRFSPATSIDFQLLYAFFLSLFWGGRPGTRPAWLFTCGDDNDPERGRGIGKSKLVEFAAKLVGGFFDVSHTEDIVAIRKRLLTPSARHLRVARVDNLKSMRFSWADLEALITAPVISGHQMYAGEGRRPNTLTWALTLNGANLSKDMAQRCIPVHLARPAFSAVWESETVKFIDDNRLQIIADIGGYLSANQGSVI